MFFRSLICMVFFLSAGCVARAPKPVETVPGDSGIVDVDRSSADSADTPDESAPLADFMPAACERLLTTLAETQPLLINLDESLLGQTNRVEEAIDRLQQPPPEPQAQDCPASQETSLGRKEIIGAIEWLYMEPPGRHYQARVDSGVETSSLSASDVVEFERDGDDWVRFTFKHDSADDAVEFELPIKRVVRVRQVSSDEPERRIVVEIDIRLGQQLQTTDFALTDRGHMTYPVLLGRAFLLDLYVVDVARSYTHERFDAT